MINDIMFTNEGNLATIKGVGRNRIVHELYKFNDTDIEIKKNMGLYEHVSYPRLYDNQHALYNEDTETYYRLLEVNINNTKYFALLGMVEYPKCKFTSIRLFNSEGKLETKPLARELMMVLNNTRQVEDISDLCEILIYEIRTNSLLHINEHDIQIRYEESATVELFSLKRKDEEECYNPLGMSQNNYCCTSK